MNGQPTVNYPTNNNTEQLIGKFHVVNVDKLPINSLGSHDESTTAAVQQSHPTAVPSSTADESACASRFQMIRVDRNFGRGRWKVNDYEPPENTSTSTNPPVCTNENEPGNISNSLTLSTIPTATINSLPTNVSSVLPGDSNTTSSAALAATAASAAAAAAAFQQQQQIRMALNNSAAIAPNANVQPPTGLLHGYPPGAMGNMGTPNQPYLLQNHHQFGYYPFFPPPYSHYAAQWAALAAANPYLPPPQMPPTSQLPIGNLGDPIWHADTVPDINSENSVISSNPFSNPTNDHLQNAQLAAAAASYMYATHHPHSAYVSQAPPTGASPYATIASYHPAPPQPTIIPPTQPLSLAQFIPNNTTDIQQQQLYQAFLSQQQPPLLTSPKHEIQSTKTPVQQSTISKATTQTKPGTTTANGIHTDTLKTTNPTHITDLLSSSPSITHSQQQQPPASLLSPITVQTTNPTNNNTNNNNSPNKTPATSLNDIWALAAGSSPLNLSQAAAQTAAVSAVAAINLLNNESGKNTEIANEILKGLTTPTKQNTTTDIDNKISAAMDLVKTHLLSAVREEITELRQQIRTLTDRVNIAEHENVFLRQHVPSGIYAQYTPLSVALSAVNDSTNPTTIATTTTTAAPSSSIMSSQTIPLMSQSSLTASVPQQPSLSTTTSQQPPPSSTNLPPT